MTYEEVSKHPLCWPEGWPRTNPAVRDHPRFHEHTVAQAWEALRLEMNRLEGEQWLMSSNIPRTQRGAPNCSIARLSDPGVSVWFKRKKKTLTIACDRWLRVEDNLWAIAKSIEAIRGIERWGASEIMERAFRGFTALPGIGESSGIQWWKVLGVPINSTRDQVKEAYRLLAKKHHPDTVNGSRELWDRIDQAMRQFEAVQPK